MKLKRLIWAVLPVAAALALTACSSSDDASETPTAPKSGVKQIPYTVTVDGNTTRATVDDDLSTLRFAAGDQLYITGENISGTLNLTSDPGSTSGTFEGTLDYTGQGDPAANLKLDATLKSATQKGWKGDGTIDYSAATLYANVKDAVKDYSYLTGACEYGNRALRLTQHTAFLNIVVSFKNGTAANVNKTASFAYTNGNDPVTCSGSVTTYATDAAVQANFVVPVPSELSVAGATITLDNDQLTLKSNELLSGKVYNVSKTVCNTPAVGMIIGANGYVYQTVSDAVADGTTGVAIIAYLGSETAEAEFTGGLAFALKDALNPNPNDYGTLHDVPYNNFNTPIMNWSSQPGTQQNTYMSEDISQILGQKESGMAITDGRGDQTDDDNIIFPAFYAAVNNTITVDAQNDGITANVLEDGCVSCSSWFLPSIYQWNQMVKGMTGCTDDFKGYTGPNVDESEMGDSPNDNLKAEKFNATITSAGGVALIPGGYWSSSERTTITGWNYNCGFGCAYSNDKAVWAKVRATVAFNVVQ